MTTTLNLGVLEFAADADPDGKSVRVVIRGAIDTDVHFMTVDEWQSLCDLAAEHAKDRERLTAERDKARSELSLFTANERDIVAMPGSDLANFQAEARRLVRERDRLRSFVTDLADEDCSYGDDCPSNARHYRCLRCKAKEALNAD